MNILYESFSDEEILALPVLTLAHIGDGVYELMARVHAVKGESVKVGDVNAGKRALVCAESQAEAAKAIFPLLTEKEAAVFKRGRNSKPGNVPHHATAGQYAMATALETLFGYLYLTRSEERLCELWEAALRVLWRDRV